MTREHDSFSKRKSAGESITSPKLIIDRRERRLVGGTWVSGTIEGYRFHALVFPDHAPQPSYELGYSRISKLEIRRIRDGQPVFSWDRGLDSPPADEQVAQRVELLCEILADRVYPTANNPSEEEA